MAVEQVNNVWLTSPAPKKREWGRGTAGEALQAHAARCQTGKQNSPQKNEHEKNVVLVLAAPPLAPPVCDHLPLAPRPLPRPSDPHYPYACAHWIKTEEYEVQWLGLRGGGWLVEEPKHAPGRQR